LPLLVASSSYKDSTTETLFTNPTKENNLSLATFSHDSDTNIEVKLSDQQTEASRDDTRAEMRRMEMIHPNSSVSSSLDTGITPSSDFGFAVILKQTNQLTSGDIAFFLNERWKPKNQAEVPTSIQRRKGREVTRRLNIELLSRFPWLAVSRHQEHEGL